MQEGPFCAIFSFFIHDPVPLAKSLIGVKLYFGVRVVFGVQGGGVVERGRGVVSLGLDASRGGRRSE